MSCLPVCTFLDLVLGLRIVQVTIPSAVLTGHNATLICEHDTEGDNLYSVKWYKGRREFFRYTPKEIPAVKLFSIHGINVDVSNKLNTYSTSVNWRVLTEG